MPTECSAKPMGFARVAGRAVMADFGGGAITSNAGGLLLGATDRAIGLVERFAACFADSRTPERVVHEVATLVGQRVFGIALGYEDLVDHDRLRHDPVLGVVLGRLEGRKYMSSSLLLVDEMGYDPMSREEASLFFRLVTYRYGRGAMIITTNKSIRDWTELLAGDEVLATAILDRLLHRAHVLNIKGRSYRLRDLEDALKG